MPASSAFRAEALGYIVPEALAADMPTIASAVGGVPEIFGAVSLALVQPSAEAISSRMATALADPEGFKAAMRAPAGLRARFGVEVMAADVQKANYACRTADRCRTQTEARDGEFLSSRRRR